MSEVCNLESKGISQRKTIGLLVLFAGVCAAVGMLVVAVGAFILRSLVTLFFGSDYVEYDATG